MNNNSISGVILTHNNEKTIKDCILSIRDVIDELIICDDFSSDRTVEIIKSIYPSAKILKRKLDRFDFQRNYALENAKGRWIIMMDSDEIVSPELARLISTTVKNYKNDYEAYGCWRLNHFFDFFIKGKQLGMPILFKQYLRFKNPVHEILDINDKQIGFLDASLIHNTYENIEDSINKLNKYTTLQVEKWIEQKRNYSKAQLILLSILLTIYEFYRNFFVDKRYKQGFFKGFLFSVLFSISWIVMILKYYEKIFFEKEISHQEKKDF